MTIQFIKGDSTKRSTISCIRADGSSTFTHLHPGMEMHDLAHYAVETVLGFEQGFFGLLRQGYHITDFERARDQRIEALMPSNLPIQSIQAEYLVNQLMTELNSGRITDFIDLLRSTLLQKNIPFPETLREQSLLKIRSLLQELIQKWNQVPVREKLELLF